MDRKFDTYNNFDEVYAKDRFDFGAEVKKHKPIPTDVQKQALLLSPTEKIISVSIQNVQKYKIHMNRIGVKSGGSTMLWATQDLRSPTRAKACRESYQAPGKINFLIFSPTQ